MNPYKRIQQFARELIGQPTTEENIRQAALRAFGKRRSKEADPVGAAREIIANGTPYPAPKADLAPRLSAPKVETEKPPTDTAFPGLPEPPEPVQIPEKMWIAGALGALLAPRAAGAMLSSPVMWKQREDARRQLDWQKQVDMLLKQLDYALKARQLDIALKNAETDLWRTLFYGQYVGQLGQRLPYQNAKDAAAALNDIANAFHQTMKIPMEIAQQYAEMVLKAGDPRVDTPERIKLLTEADRLLRSHGFLLNPQGLKQMFPFLDLPEIPIVTPIPGATPPAMGTPPATGTQPATGATPPATGAAPPATGIPPAGGETVTLPMPEGGQVDVIDLGSPEEPAPPAGGQPQTPLSTSPYSPAQQRTIAEREYLESQAGMNRERQKLIRQQTEYYRVRTEQLPKELELEEKRADAALKAAEAALKNADTRARQLGLDALNESFNAINDRIIRYLDELDNVDAFIRELGKQVPQIETRQQGPNGEVITVNQPDWSRAPREMLDARNRALQHRQRLLNNINKLQNKAAQIQQKIEKFR